MRLLFRLIKMEKRKIIVFSILVSAGILINIYYEIMFGNPTPWILLIKSDKEVIANYNYIINNNLAQYSVYLTKNETKYTIEAYVFFNFKFNNNFKIENYICLVKLINIHNYHEKEETIVVNAKFSPGYYFDANRMIMFEFDEKDFDSYYADSNKFNVNNIVLAVVSKLDYDPDLSEAELNEKFDWSQIFKNERIVFPYSMIKYQKPIVYDDNGKNKILNTVSSCIHYSYGQTVPSYLKDWINMHFEFGVAEIMFYDSTQNMTLTEYLRDTFPNDYNNKIKIKPYRITAEELCDESRLPESQFSKLQELVKKQCLNFFKLEFFEYIWGRAKHEQITSNDCITDLGKRHQYVTYYDLDEFVFPRTMNLSRVTFKCDESSCSKKPFQQGNNETSSFYNYLDSLVDKYKGDRDKSKLNFISFDHSAYLIIKNNETNTFISNLGSLLETVEKKQIETKFPMYVVLTDQPTRGHKFIVEENDIDYVRYLFESYNSLKRCTRNINFSIDLNLDRFLYFLTEPAQRWPKCIYNGKNVRAAFLHYPTDVVPDTWDLKPSAFDGHMLPHFRKDITQLYDGNFNSSITKLRIDFEYFYFMMNKFSDFC